jgi:hypothetical protein
MSTMDRFYHPDALEFGFTGPLHIGRPNVLPNFGLVAPPSISITNTVPLQASSQRKKQSESRRYGNEEWNKQKERIKTLYSDKDNTLDDVMRIMREGHGFYATYVPTFNSFPFIATNPLALTC